MSNAKAGAAAPPGGEAIGHPELIQVYRRFARLRDRGTFAGFSRFGNALCHVICVMLLWLMRHIDESPEFHEFRKLPEAKVGNLPDADFLRVAAHFASGWRTEGVNPTWRYAIDSFEGAADHLMLMVRRLWVDNTGNEPRREA